MKEIEKIIEYLQKKMEVLDHYITEALVPIVMKYDMKASVDSIDAKTIMEDPAFNEEHGSILTEYGKLKDMKTTWEYIYSATEEEIAGNRALFDQFEDFYEIAKEIQLNSKEILNVIEYVVRKNSSLVIDPEANLLCVNLTKVVMYPFQKLTQNDIKEIVKTPTNFIRVLSGDEEALTKKELAFQRQFYENREHFLTEDFLYKATKELQIHFLEKRDSFDEEDLPIILDSLKKMGLDSETLILIEKRLRKEMTRRIEKSKEETKVEYAPLKSEKRYLTEKEYKTILKEIKKYFNPYHGKVLQEMDYETMLYIARLMYEIDLEEYIIQNFIRKVMMTLTEEKNVISEYLRMYDCLSYYFTEEELTDIDAYFKEIFICDDNDYVIWKEEIEKILHTLKYKVPDSYAYELEKAKKLVI